MNTKRHFLNCTEFGDGYVEISVPASQLSEAQQIEVCQNASGIESFATKDKAGTPVIHRTAEEMENIIKSLSTEELESITKVPLPD